MIKTYERPYHSLNFQPQNPSPHCNTIGDAIQRSHFTNFICRDLEVPKIERSVGHDEYEQSLAPYNDFLSSIRSILLHTFKLKSLTIGDIRAPSDSPEKYKQLRSGSHMPQLKTLRFSNADPESMDELRDLLSAHSDSLTDVELDDFSIDDYEDDKTLHHELNRAGFAVEYQSFMDDDPDTGFEFMLLKSIC